MKDDEETVELARQLKHQTTMRKMRMDDLKVAVAEKTNTALQRPVKPAAPSPAPPAAAPPLPVVAPVPPRD